MCFVLLCLALSCCVVLSNSPILSWEPPHQPHMLQIWTFIICFAINFHSRIPCCNDSLICLFILPTVSFVVFVSQNNFTKNSHSIKKLLWKLFWIRNKSCWMIYHQTFHFTLYQERERACQKFYSFRKIQGFKYTTGKLPNKSELEFRVETTENQRWWVLLTE